jgi:hypothetical protein
VLQDIFLVVFMPVSAFCLSHLLILRQAARARLQNPQRKIDKKAKQEACLHKALARRGVNKKRAYFFTQSKCNSLKKPGAKRNFNHGMTPVKQISCSTRMLHVVAYRSVKRSPIFWTNAVQSVLRRVSEKSSKPKRAR